MTRSQTLGGGHHSSHHKDRNGHLLDVVGGRRRACRSLHLAAGAAPSALAPWLTWAADCSAALLALRGEMRKVEEGRGRLGGVAHLRRRRPWAIRLRRLFELVVHKRGFKCLHGCRRVRRAPCGSASRVPLGVVAGVGPRPPVVSRWVSSVCRVLRSL